MCCNPHYLAPYSREVDYQTTPQVQEDVTEGMPRLYSALEHWSKYGSFDFSSFAPEKTSTEAIISTQENFEEYGFPDPDVSTPVQPTPPETPQPMDILKRKREELSAVLDIFKRSFDNKVEHGSKRNTFKKISKELASLGESQLGLINFLEGIDPFDGDGHKELEEDLSMTSSSQDDKSLLEKYFEENTQIPNKEKGEVDHNNEFDDLEPSLYIGEKEKEEWKLECLEPPRDIIKFVEAQIEELPVYIL